ncbi:hypothetical protein [Roseospira goensis]|uniref:Uncharacterized membrane protein (DUF485 family) n=1 Tax=Roseospira goensis TaxID=391922 RepID=A0A7W6WJM6_9PROT|nr:hypothetical protein [Roseospira goensis]MBB4285180.1 uncharacterized membrane protein (DUF485 family) [Roseospira goensis]
MTVAAGERGHRGRDRLAGGLIVVVWAGVLVQALAGTSAPGPVAVTLVALAAYLLTQAGCLSRTAWAHLSVGAAVALTTVVLLDDPGPTLVTGLGRAAFLAALFAALGTLREAARASPMVHETGRMLTQQPPGRRYVAITAGGTLFGAILNFGAIGLLGGMIQDANTVQAARGEARIRAIRERRMMLALLRGFSVLMFWCPLTVAYAIVGETLAGAHWTGLMTLGLGMAVIVMAIGWTLDRLTMPRPRAVGPRAPFRWRRLGPLLGLLLLVFGPAVAVEQLTAGRLIHGVILVVPVLATAWLTLARGPAGAARRLGRYLATAVPNQRAEIAVLGNAAFMGAAIAGVLPAVGLHDPFAGLTGLGMPTVLVPAVVPWLVVAAGQAGANPLLTVTVLVALIGDPAALGVSPTVLGLGLVMGWGLTVGSSPATAATMMIGRMTDRSAAAVGRGWNGGHTLVSLTAVSLALAGLHLAWP